MAGTVGTLLGLSPFRVGLELLALRRAEAVGVDVLHAALGCLLLGGVFKLSPDASLDLLVL